MKRCNNKNKEIMPGIMIKKMKEIAWHGLFFEGI